MIIFYSEVRDSDGERPELTAEDAAVMLTFADIYNKKGDLLHYFLQQVKERKKQRLKARRIVRRESAKEDEAVKELADRLRNKLDLSP